MTTHPTDLLREARERHAQAVEAISHASIPGWVVEASLADIPALLDLAADRERLRDRHDRAIAEFNRMLYEKNLVKARIAELERALQAQAARCPKCTGNGQIPHGYNYNAASGRFDWSGRYEPCPDCKPIRDALKGAAK